MTTDKHYVFLPQHFLYLRSLPQTQGSLRPILGVFLVIGFFGGQQLVSVQLDDVSFRYMSFNNSVF